MPNLLVIRWCGDVVRATGNPGQCVIILFYLLNTIHSPQQVVQWVLNANVMDNNGITFSDILLKMLSQTGLVIISDIRVTFVPSRGGYEMSASRGLD